MLTRNKYKNKYLKFFLTFTMFLFIAVAHAAVMQGTTYSIEFDSINTAGRNSTSSNYRIEDSLGEVATGYSSSTNYSIHAGFQQLEESTISISAPADINLASLTLTKNSAVSGATWSVITNNSAGYALALTASTTPALKGNAGRAFNDFSTSTPSTWIVSNNYVFGFSVYGADVNTSTYGTDTDCISVADVPSGSLKWRGFYGTNSIVVVNDYSSAPLPGSDTTMCVATEQNGVFVPSDTYTAIITATAVTN